MDFKSFKQFLNEEQEQDQSVELTPEFERMMYQFLRKYLTLTGDSTTQSIQLRLKNPDNPNAARDDMFADVIAEVCLDDLETYQDPDDSYMGY